jgi:hypothetical protein
MKQLSRPIDRVLEERLASKVGGGVDRVHQS